MQPKSLIAPLGAAGVACILGVASLSAAVYELGPTQDARILGLGSHQANNFRDDILSVYTMDANVQRTLLQFNLGQVVLAPGERLASATLTLYASLGYGGTGGQPTELYAVSRPWSEDGLTWLQASTGFPWTTAGGDFVGADGLPDRAPFAVSTTESPAQSGPVDWDVRELVDLCLEAGRANHGFLLKSSEGNGLTFSPRESASPALRPRLQLVTEDGPPRLQAVYEPATGNMRLSWRGVGTAILQERPATGLNVAWSDSPSPVSAVNGRSLVTLAPSPPGRWFRLRSL